MGAALVAASLAILLIAVAVWIWSGSISSLGTALRLVATMLPDHQSLVIEGATGSLREGGSVGRLLWKNGALEVEAREIDAAWIADAWTDGHLRIPRLHAASLRITDQRPSTAPAAPADFALPVRIDATVSIGQLEWAGTPILRADNLAFHYTFDSNAHIIDGGQVRISSGNYQFDGQLQAHTPMQLEVRVKGVVDTPLPRSGTLIRISADTQVQGALAGQDAELHLQARLTPDSPAPKAAAMQAVLSARLQPWHTQTIAQADAQWNAVNLAAFWPQAPQTLLSGSATVVPTAADWLADVHVRNTLSGPWNRHLLPLDSGDAKLAFAGGQWTVEALQATLAQGRIEASGGITPTGGWNGQVSLQGIDPAALDSRLASQRLDGTVTVRQTQAGIAFDALLQNAAGPTATALTTATTPLRIQRVQASGTWLAPRMQLDQLALETVDAKLYGPVDLNTTTMAIDGDLQLNLPGAQARWTGQLSGESGNGNLQLQVSDATLAARWLNRWPGMAAPASLPVVTGSGALTASWQGGWREQGRDLQLTVAGQAEQGQSKAIAQLQATITQEVPGQWRAALGSAQFTLHSRQQAVPWSLQLDSKTPLIWRNATGVPTRLEIGAGSATLRGPVPGLAELHWVPARWSSGPRGPWSTRGTLQGLPLAWLEYFGQTKLANFGLQGDLLLGGQWDAAGGDLLRIDAQLQRSSGDLKIAADDAATRLLEAGLRTASVALAVRDTQLSSTMVWDSERAGQVQAQWNTHVEHKADTWTWSEDAPVAGSLRAQLPRLGVWSLLAPPGWRLRGTLDADAVLSGTRRNPLWQGSIKAQDLAARSVVDGIDFSRGTLNAKLDGQRLDIVDFTLLGPGAKAGAGVLSLRGTAQWLPTTVAAPASAIALSRLRMDLEATARVLRINTRPDQRLDVSGNVSAQFLDNTLRVRGALTADQALFILAEDSTPQLGSDVVVRNRPAVEVESATRPKPVPGNGAAAVKTDVAMTLDLGSNFQVKGYGLDTRLEGQLALTASQVRKARLTGELHAVNGTYKAYGQKLDIEEGVLRFSGPYDNPALDVLAIRPNLQQRVGVQISGTALAPVVRLYAEPDLPDAEKLAWLVLGRSSANGGAETALLQQAGLALLGGSKGGLTVGLAETLGLDELSMRGLVNSGDASSVGSNTTTGATVTLGKRLSRNFYVAYERSLAGAFGTFYVFYDLSKRFTLRAETGEQSAVDLIFTTRYD